MNYSINLLIKIIAFVGLTWASYELTKFGKMLTQQMDAQSKEIKMLNQRNVLLEKGFAPTSEEALIKTFAMAMNEGNGAVTFMLFCPELQKKQFPAYQEKNWQSPTDLSVTGYKLRNEQTHEYTIIFTKTLQGVSKITSEIVLVVSNTKTSPLQHYCIEKYI